MGRIGARGINRCRRGGQAGGMGQFLMALPRLLLQSVAEAVAAAPALVFFDCFEAQGPYVFEGGPVRAFELGDPPFFAFLTPGLFAVEGKAVAAAPASVLVYRLEAEGVNMGLPLGMGRSYKRAAWRVGGRSGGRRLFFHGGSEKRVYYLLPQKGCTQRLGTRHHDRNQRDNVSSILRKRSG